MKNKIVYVSIFLCLAGLAVAAEYTDWQNGAIEGLSETAAAHPRRKRRGIRGAAA